MTGVAPHIHPLVATRLDLFQVIIDTAQHSQHFTGPVLVWILVGGKIVRAEGFTFLSLMAMRATNTQCSRESNHHRCQLGAGPVLWQYLEIRRFLRPRPAFLCLTRKSKKNCQ